MIIINAENNVIGRVASYAAKQILLKREVVIVNSEKTIVTGRKKSIIKKFEEKRARGGNILRGPFYPSTPIMILKRAVKGMLPGRYGREKEAIARVKCYEGIPKEFENEKMIKVSREKAGTTLKEISILLRGGNND
ncbi:50S ribosomal protein L13 [Candidatus Pacearchaeota archaeon]|nr:50S ribosomal protein L13 [Candidatus Pacearchaeota archaeon]